MTTTTLDREVVLEPVARAHAQPAPVDCALVAPEPIECLPVRPVTRRLAVVQHELAELARRADALELEAAEVETRVVAEGAAEEGSLPLAVELHRFLTVLREEAEEEALAVVAAARVEARLLARGSDRRGTIFDARMRQWQRLVAHRRAPAVPGSGISWRASAPATPAPSFVPDDDAAASESAAPVRADHGFWAEADTIDARRDRVRLHVRFTRSAVLRVAAAGCVVAAVVVRLA